MKETKIIDKRGDKPKEVRFDTIDVGEFFMEEHEVVLKIRPIYPSNLFRNAVNTVDGFLYTYYDNDMVASMPTTTPELTGLELFESLDVGQWFYDGGDLCQKITAYDPESCGDSPIINVYDKQRARATTNDDLDDLTTADLVNVEIHIVD